MKYDRQKETGEIEGHNDSDWAGCKKPSKSTSGEAVINGTHCVKSRNSTKSVPLGSGEAEVVATVQISAEMGDLMQMAKEWGDRMAGRVVTDSSAAVATSKEEATESHHMGE